MGANSGCGTRLNHGVVLVGYTDPAEEYIKECKTSHWWHSCNVDKHENDRDANGYANYWKVQNSWGTGWGDQGFILMEIAEGAGVCGMNGMITYVDV